MKTLSALLIIVLLFCGCSKKESPEAKRPTVDPLQAVQNEEPVIKAATPEDPGPTATVVSPLSILQEQAKSSQTKAEENVPRQTLLVDHHVNPALQEPKKILHKMFSVNKYAQFAFVVPPHEANTRLRGTFSSFTKRGDAASSDRAADVDLMLFNEEEFKEFLHGQIPSVNYEVESAHNQIVDWRVPTTYGDPQTYHLVFSNSAGTKVKFVEADFTVSFQ
jgi:hypothetical protein